MYARIVTMRAREPGSDIGAAAAVIGVLLWIRRDLRHDIADMRADVRALNARIDNILLARRQA